VRAAPHVVRAAPHGVSLSCGCRIMWRRLLLPHLDIEVRH
jgi:hypothetical protein